MCDLTERQNKGRKTHVSPAQLPLGPEMWTPDRSSKLVLRDQWLWIEPHAVDLVFGQVVNFAEPRFHCLQSGVHIVLSLRSSHED